MLAATGLFVALPAQADYSECTSTSTCIWDDNDFGGAHASRAQGLTTIKNVTAAMDNKMDSWANNSSDYNSCGYGGYLGAGDKQSWGLRKNDNNVSVVNSDEVSSWRTAGGC